MDVKTLCLGILSTGDASGYEIKKMFEDAFSHFYVAGYGSIYPALAELSKDGHVTCSNIEQDKRPAKKVYHLTPQGHDAFVQALADSYPYHRVRSDFLMMMLFSHLLSPEQVDSMLETRLRDIEHQVAEIERYTKSNCGAECNNLLPGAKFVSDFGVTVLNAGRDFIQRHRAELKQSLEQQQEKAS